MVFKVNPVAGKLDKGEMQVKRFDVGRFTAGNEHGGGQVLGGIPRNDGHQAVQIDATAQDGCQQQHQNDMKD